MSFQGGSQLAFIPKVEPLGGRLLVYALCLLTAIIYGLFYLLGLESNHNNPPRCRNLGLRKASNLTDEHAQKYTKARPQKEGGPRWTVKSLWIYPIKSCKGVELNRGTVTGYGMDFDRQMSFARFVPKPKTEPVEYEWKFITQRQAPRMANITTEVWVPDPSSADYDPSKMNVESGGIVVIKFPCLRANFLANILRKTDIYDWKTSRTVHIPINPTKEQIKYNGYRTQKMTIWGDSPRSLVLASTEDPTSWIHDLKAYLKLNPGNKEITEPFALFSALPSQRRELFRNAPRKAQLGYQPSVGFQDAFPLHILNLASVRDVGSKLVNNAPPLSARNFRPNIIITGGQAYAEDSWKRIKIGDEEYHASCRTVRCLLPNVNQDSGIKHESEPNRTLKSFRCIDEGDGKNACLGMQMVPAEEERRVIKVGDEIEVLETGEHFYIKQ